MIITDSEGMLLLHLCDRAAPAKHGGKAVITRTTARSWQSSPSKEEDQLLRPSR